MTKALRKPSKIIITVTGNVSNWLFQAGQVYTSLDMDDHFAYPSQLCCTAIQPKGGKRKDYSRRNSYLVRTEDGNVYLPQFMAKVLEYRSIAAQDRDNREWGYCFDDDESDEDDDDM